MDPSQQIALVSGATSGIGQAVALGLAKVDLTVVLVARDPGRGEAAISAIKAASGNDRIDLILADLSSQAAIRSLAETYKASFSRLDVLVNSAAVYLRSRELTTDGLETMFAVNHLGYFLLTNLLLEPLQASGEARVINITAPSTVQLDFADLQGERHFNALNAFGATKMANLLFTFELARRLEGTGIAVNAVHPGIVKTNLTRQMPALMRWGTNLMAAAPERAAEPIARLATAPEFAGQSGRFYRNAAEIKPPAYSLDQSVQHKLWEVSEKLTKL